MGAHWDNERGENIEGSAAAQVFDTYISTPSRVSVTAGTTYQFIYCNTERFSTILKQRLAMA